jgi:glutathione-regulated potassium-efflux system protein KefB
LTLLDISILLGAAVIAVPLAKWLRIGSVLGYLVAGIVIGPYGAGQIFSVYEAKEILHFAEFGIVLLLFLIGLELRPTRLWSMRSAIFGLGGAQVALTALVLAAIGTQLGFNNKAALFAGLALALSSTAFALQVLEERGELTARHGRLAFAVLLFQDLAAIPLIALTPLFAGPARDALKQMGWDGALIGLATIAVVVVLGRYVLDHVFRLVAKTRVKEAMTATALLTVISVTLIMQTAGLSASLGAFLAGALLADSSYRHQIEADIQPFQGLLLGLFFTAVGMSLSLSLLVERPGAIIALVAGIVAIKILVLYGLGRWYGLEHTPARRLGISISQGGEFAFALFAGGLALGVLSRAEADLLTLVVTLSMVATPLLLLIEDAASELLARRSFVAPLYDAPPANDGHVIIAGFGRFGQIVARVLRAKGIPFTALDVNPDQVELVRRFGSQAFYGDASRADILDAAQAGKARAFVLAIDDVEASMRTAEMVKQRYPDLAIYARARDRTHAHRLLDLGVRALQRETFLSALEVTRDVMRGIGLPEREVERTISTFRKHDDRRLIEDYKDASDIEKLLEKARTDAVRLEKLFAEDAEEERRIAEAAKQRAER